MKILLEFDGEKEVDDALNAINDPNWKSVVWSLNQELRTTTKHDSSILDRSKEASDLEIEIIENIREKLFEMLEENNLSLD